MAATKKCSKCGEEKTLANFIAVNSQFFNGSLPICRDCLAKIVSCAPEGKRLDTVDKICQWANVPFIPGEWEKVAAQNSIKDSLGRYMAIFRDEEYKSLEWG